jgi:hypothetical protein
MKERAEYFRPVNTPLSERENEGNESLKKREIGIPRIVMGHEAKISQAQSKEELRSSHVSFAHDRSSLIH